MEDPLSAIAVDNPVLLRVHQELVREREPQEEEENQEGRLSHCDQRDSEPGQQAVRDRDKECSTSANSMPFVSSN